MGSLLGQMATIVGLMAGGIAVGGFLGHARPSLLGRSELKLRRATTIGGIAGLAIAVGLAVLAMAIG